MNWETVATSMLTSGGILFGAYKFWFQRRLEDHKLALQNNGKLFELELKTLQEFGVISQDILRSDLGVAKHLSDEEVFIIKAYENEENLERFFQQSTHAMNDTVINLFEKLITSYKDLQDKSKPYQSKNTTYCMGKYSCYDNLPPNVIEFAKDCREQTKRAYKTYKQEVFKKAGR
ncbi:hypothetical protein K7V76_001127 [Vibrio fluvialis]|nr:hypothetical protein [Vibrio fluvialis]EKO3521291.1 hypothetical protein [Vibrio fluvialis]EKO3525256.1 hypothetical protein [Vibrio fluvialis]EKO3530814.1 hypothetical protein [Vibrio fluvialis]EKO3545153.1 hypothetical protein [Vibrio fluvialis]